MTAAFEAPHKPNMKQRLLANAMDGNADTVVFYTALGEVIFLPVPAEAVMVPLGILDRDKALRYALMAAAGSVCGGLVAYMVGYALSGVVAGMAGSHLFDMMVKAQAFFKGYDIAAVGSAGFSPIPFALVALADGFLHGGMLSFVVAATLARVLRFGVVGWLLWRGGQYYKEWVERNFFGFSMALSAGLLIVFLVLKLLWISW